MLLLGLAAVALLIARRGVALAWMVSGARAVRAAGPLGALAAVAGVAVLTLMLVPVIPVTLACGWVYGGPRGALTVLAGASLSALASFAVGRLLGRQRAQHLLARSPRLRELAALAERGGVGTVALLRLAPLIPFTPGNAVLGMTALRPGALLLGSALGMLPGAVVYAWAGSLLPSPEAIADGTASAHQPATLLLLGLSIAAALALAGALARKLLGHPATGSESEKRSP